MKKQTLLQEVKQLQKVAGLLIEDEDLDLSNTPKFSKNALEKYKVLRRVSGSTYEVKTADGEVIRINFDYENIEDEVDPPYGYAGWIRGEDEDYVYTMSADFVDTGGGDYDIDADFSSLEVEPIPQ